MGMMSAWRQMLGMVLWSHEWLKMSVKADIPCLPRCLRWMLETPSGPTAEEFFNLLMAALTSESEKGEGDEGSGLSERIRRVMTRFSELFWSSG